MDFEIQFKIYDCIVTILATILELRTQASSITDFMAEMDSISPNKLCMDHIDYIVVIRSNFETRTGWTPESVMLPDLGYTWLSCLWKSNHCHHSSLGSLRITWLGERFSMPSKVSISCTVH